MSKEVKIKGFSSLSNLQVITLQCVGAVEKNNLKIDTYTGFRKFEYYELI